MMNCIAIDDEQLSLDLIEDNIKKIPFLTLTKKCTSVFDAIQTLNSEKIDLIFLDIEMPDMNGLQMLKTISSRPMIILITAYDKYAMQGYELDVIDYLLKPVSFDRFVKAANKALDYHAHKSEVSLGQSSKNSIFIKSEHKILKVNISEIEYIESLKDYIKIYCSGKPLLTLMSLKAIESALPSDKFIRVHRSYIIAIDKINYISHNKVFIHETGIPISNTYRDNILGLLPEL